jgi:hypothetical protein
MSEAFNLKPLIDLTSQRVLANSQDANPLAGDELPKVVSEVRNFLRTAQSGEPLPSGIRDLSSIQLLQIIYVIQKHNIYE